MLLLNESRRNIIGKSKTNDFAGEIARYAILSALQKFCFREDKLSVSIPKKMGYNRSWTTVFFRLPNSMKSLKLDFCNFLRLYPQILLHKGLQRGIRIFLISFFTDAIEPADSSTEQSSEELELTEDVSQTLFSAGDFESLSGKLESLLQSFLLPLIS